MTLNFGRYYYRLLLLLSDRYDDLPPAGITILLPPDADAEALGQAAEQYLREQGYSGLVKVENSDVRKITIL